MLHCFEVVGYSYDPSKHIIATLLFVGNKRAGILILDKEAYANFVHYEVDVCFVIGRFARFNPMKDMVENFQSWVRKQIELTSTPHRVSVVLHQDDLSKINWFNSVGFRCHSNNDDSCRFIWPNDDES